MENNWLETLKQRYTDDRFFYEIFTQEIYQLARAQGKVNTILDVGACAGEFSFYIYDYADKIYAIEPEPREYIELTDNITEFGLEKIVPFRLALSDRNGEGHLRCQDRGGHFYVPDQATDSVRVKTVTLNTFLEENKIKSVDILKIDIENGENKVFSAPDIDKALKKVKFIIGEHGNLDLLTAQGFNVEKTHTGWIATK